MHYPAVAAVRGGFRRNRLEPRSRLMPRPRKSCSAFLVPPGFRVGAGDDTPVAGPTIHWPFRRATTIGSVLSSSGIEVPPLPSMPGPRMGRAVQELMVELRFAVLRKMQAGAWLCVFGWAHLLAWSDDAPPTSLASSLCCSPCCSGTPTFGSCGSCPVPLKSAPYRRIRPIGAGGSVPDNQARPGDHGGLVLGGGSDVVDGNGVLPGVQVESDRQAELQADAAVGAPGFDADQLVGMAAGELVGDAKTQRRFGSADHGALRTWVNGSNRWARWLGTRAGPWSSSTTTARSPTRLTSSQPGVLGGP